MRLTRRALLALPLGALGAQSQDQTDFLRALEPLASALSYQEAGEPSASGDVGRQVDAFGAGLTKDFPARENLLLAIEALLRIVFITSSIVVLRVENGVADVDWLMDMRQKGRRVSDRRRERLNVEIRDGKVSKITPVTFFRLPGT
ncbi:MAG TPA: hypothetical protein VEQ63_07720 [Bryobacteraceae bacterium]|nr:hypothetical protein [Bryobacteraceae bacterium]